MEIGICSFSFHRLLAAGKQDIFQYIDDCKALGCTQLDPWNAHLAALKPGDSVLHAGRNPDKSDYLSAADEEYITRVRAYSDAAGVPFGCIAVDGAHIWDDDPAKRAENRQRAYRWLDVAQKLGATSVRIDAGGPEEMGGSSYDEIKAGYRDVIDRAAAAGIDVLVENHWGPTIVPENCIKLVEEVEGLKLLLDTNNFKPELRAHGRKICAPYAHALHVKTFAFDENGDETEADIPTAIGHLLDAGYNGVWGVESVPRDGDEIEGARKTIALIHKLAG